MFGIVYALYNAVGRLIYNARHDHAKTMSKIDALDNNKETYIDNVGNEWLICNNGKDKKVHRKYDVITGHDMLIDAKTGEKLIDYTFRQELNEESEFLKRKKEAKEKAIKDGKKYYTVIGILDQRYGQYELETDRMFSLYNKVGLYFKQYYDVTKDLKKCSDCKIISKEEYKKLGG